MKAFSEPFILIIVLVYQSEGSALESYISYCSSFSLLSILVSFPLNMDVWFAVWITFKLTKKTNYIKYDTNKNHENLIQFGTANFVSDSWTM